MKVSKIYLETTMFNYYFDDDRDAHEDTVALFEECAAGRFEPYTSDYVLYELNEAPDEKRGKMIELVRHYNITILAANDETNALAMRYVSEGALPKGSLTDASHIASASVNGLDAIISLNFKHIVRTRTAKMTGAINILLGYGAIDISTPMEVIDYEKTRYHIGRSSRDSSED